MSSNTKWDPKSFFGVRQLFSHGPTNGVHILDFVLESAMFFFLAMFAESVSSFVRLTTLIVLPEVFEGIFGLCFCHESFA